MSLPSASPDRSASIWRRLSFHFQGFQLVEAFLFGRRVLFRLGEFDERDRVQEFAIETAERAKPVLKLGPLAHDFLRGFGIVPKSRIFGLGV